MPRPAEYYDEHIPTDYRLHGWEVDLDPWGCVSLYREWLDSDGVSLSPERRERLSDFLSHVLMAARWDAPHPCAEAVGVDFDVDAPSDDRRCALIHLGWPGGVLPSAPVLVAHVLDRLECDCALDIAFASGRAAHIVGATGPKEARPSCCPTLEIFERADAIFASCCKFAECPPPAPLPPMPASRGPHDEFLEPDASSSATPVATPEAGATP